ncbi:MAG: histidine phosphatase family protein [Treponema sp.]|jgi:broad specificity phosphatase PhoE|nr:histidine phosphatase family protein [Treponema sp.]
MKADFFASLERAVDFYVIRHGQSEGNAAGILQGRGEYSLSEKGRAQAAARGRGLKAKLADAVNSGRALLFSSPLGRARITSEIIAETAGFPAPVFIEDLREMELGLWSGKRWEEARMEDAALWDRFMAHSWDAVPGAEPSAGLYGRALRAWAALRDAAVQCRAEKVIAVSHGGLIQWLLKTTFGCRRWFPLFPTANCGLSILRVEPAGEGVCTQWNVLNERVEV